MTGNGDFLTGAEIGKSGHSKKVKCEVQCREESNYKCKITETTNFSSAVSVWVREFLSRCK